MWTWIFLIGFALASAVALALYFNLRWRQESIDYWHRSYKDAERKRRETETALFSALAGYCRSDFDRRMLCAQVELTTEDGERHVRFNAAPGGTDGESWRFSVDVKDGGIAAYVCIEAWPGGRKSYLFMRVEPGEEWHRNAVRLVEEAKRGAAAKLTHQEAGPLVRAFLGDERRPAWTSRIDFGPAPSRHGEFPSLDDPMDDMD